MSIRSRSPSAEEKATRMNSLKGLNKELKDVQKEIVEVKTRIDMSFDSDIRPPRHSRREKIAARGTRGSRRTRRLDKI